jgi:thioredoxin-related protein
MKPLSLFFTLLVSAGLLISGSLYAQPSDAASEAKGTYSGNNNATHPEWFKESFLDFSEDIEEAAADGKRLVLYFWQTGCPYCNQLWEHNMAAEGIEEAFQSQYEVVAINMWGDQDVVTVAGKQFTEKELARALDVDFTPTLLFYDEKKQNILRLNGYLPPKKFKAALAYGSGAYPPGQKFSEYLLDQSKSTAALSTPALFFKSAQAALSNRSKTAADRPLAVVFEVPECETCVQFHAVTLGKHPITRDLLAKMDVVQLNALSKDNITKPNGEVTTASEWARELDLNYYPSIALFDEDGEQVMLMNAYFRNFHTQSVFAYVLEKAYIQQPSFQRYLTARVDELTEKGIDVDIWEQ